jgi:hypothetical protein
MGIKRYTANADTTITNAYKTNLTTRATSSNMGLADSLEVFRIYGQESSGSSELSRVLIDFPISSDIASDRSAGLIPASGSVSWYLRVFNVAHPSTLPRNYNMTVTAVSRSWDEGTGLDMEGYTDTGYANWTSAASSSGGITNWTAPGGDYHAAPTYTAPFTNGTEDIELDISELVEQWIKGTSGGGQDTYGVGIRMENESAFSSSYTKMFSARGSEYFFKRPVLEARWDSATKDDRGNFYYSSSLAPAVDNLNTIYLYNHVRGRLTNIPSIGTGEILVSVYSGSANNTAPSGSKLLLAAGGGVATDLDTNATGGYVSTGIYSCSFAITGASTPLSHLFDVWHGATTEYFTGSAIKPKTLSAGSHNPYSKHVMNVTNLRDVYYRNETAQFRLFTRQKDWCPTVYTKAVAAPAVQIVESGSFKIVRLADDFNAIPFGTGSELHTQLSFDASGSYFDLDISMLQAGYAYGIKFAFYDDVAGTWNEYPDLFKFRVEE